MNCADAVGPGRTARPGSRFPGVCPMPTVTPRGSSRSVWVAAPAERRGFWGVARWRSGSRLSLTWRLADPVELFGPAAVW